MGISEFRARYDLWSRRSGRPGESDVRQCVRTAKVVQGQCTASMMSTGPADRTFTVAEAFGRQVFAPAETTILKPDDWSSSAAASGEADNNRPNTPAAARNC